MTSVLERLLPSVDQVVAGRYRIRDELGRGGFGAVYRATHLSLNEDVAVKVLLPHLLENTSVAGRFEREVAVAKGLRHPNTIRVMDYAVTETGLPFFVMELLQGRALEEVLDNGGPVSPARARRIVNQVLKSLAEAHSHGIVHRDLKPGNIYLSEIVGEQDFVKVLDFGIAKALTGDDGMGIHTTNTGVVLGTPAYMSPEQAIGVKDLDGRSDIYAVGLILAECLTSEPLVVGDSAYVVVAQHASHTPLPLPPAVAHSPLRSVIERAVAKDRNQRYASATEMRQALDALGPLSEEAPPRGYVVPRDPRTPPPSVPHMTPISMVGGQVADPHADTMVSGPQRQPSGGLGLDQVTADTAPQTRVTPKRHGPLAALLLLLLVGGGFAIAYAVVSGGGDALDPPESESIESGITTEPEVVPPSSGQSAQPAIAEGSAPSQTPLVAALDPAALERRFAVRTAMAIAAERLSGAVPMSRPVRFEGTDVTVVLGEQRFGPTPIELWLPRVNRSIELGFERQGYRSERRPISLADDSVNIELRRERTVRPEEPGRPEQPEEPEQPEQPEQPATPFGQTPIHD